MEVLIQLNGIEKRYGSTVALQLDEMAIGRGELCLLTGPNGSGKSTLLAIMALLLRPDSGSLSFAGEVAIWKAGMLQRLRQRVTLLHQSPYLFRGTVSDNVAYGLTVRGIRGQSARERVAEALDTVRLTGFEGRKTGELSGGEAQRVAMARALSIGPELLLLDEPLANVDRESAQVLEKVIAALPGSGTTVVMSSHDPQQKDRLNCRVIGLQRGRLMPEPLPDTID